MKTEFKDMLQLGHRGTEIKKVRCSKKKIKAINNYFKKVFTFLDIRNWLKWHFKRIKTQMHKPGNLKKSRERKYWCEYNSSCPGIDSRTDLSLWQSHSNEGPILCSPQALLTHTHLHMHAVIHTQKYTRISSYPIIYSSIWLQIKNLYSSSPHHAL